MVRSKREVKLATRILGLVARFIEILIRLAFLALSVAIVFGVSYFLGHVFFQGLRGNDAFNALNNIHWIDRFFPKFPYWYPLQGGGVSITWGYPLGSSVLPILVNRIFDIGLVGAFQLLGFLSLPLTAMGIYLFVWWRLKSQAGGLIAAVFYLVAPASWIWLFDWGFYAENISYIFFFPTLICFDVFFEAVLRGKGVSWRARTSLLAAAVFGGLLFATHPTPFFSLLMILSIATFIQVVWAVRRFRLDLLSKSLGLVAVFSLATVLLIGFVSLNYLHYSKFTFGYGQAAAAEKENFIYYYSTPLKPFLGLERIPQDDFKFTMRNMVIPPQIWMPAILALVLVPWVGVEAFAYAVAGLASFVLLFRPEIMFWLVKLRVPLVPYIATMRAQVVILKFMIPIAAGMGIVAVGRLLVWLPTFWIKHKWRLLWWFKKGLAFIVVPSFSLVAFVYLLVFFANKPERLWQPHEVRYGPCYFSARDPFFKFSIDICGTPEGAPWADQEVEGLSREESRFFQRVAAACAVRRDVRKVEADSQVCEELGEIEAMRAEPEEKGSLRREAYLAFAERCRQQQVTAAEQAYCPLITDDLKEILKLLVANLQQSSYWPKPDLGYAFVFEHLHPAYRDFIRENKDNQWLRIDVSPTLGGVVQGINILSDISIINLYTSQLSLLGPYWGLEQQVLFSENDGRIETVNEVAKYYGTSYLMMSEHDALEKYENSGGVWESVGVVPGTIWKYEEAPKMYSWYQTKPLILMIGDKKKRAFEPVFRAAIKGAIPYDQGILVEGSERVDDYSLQELSQFDVLFLYGYHYRNQRKAWRLLEDYVANGGALFVSTGWQYVDADWEWDWEQTATLLPVDKLEWREDFGSSSVYELDGSPIGDETLDATKLSPLVWDEKGWGVSTGEVKEWAQPVLSVDGWPLVVVGKYGEGRVVWTGLNIIGHSHTYDYNQEELGLLRALVAWLGSPEPDDDLTEFVSPRRDYPDKIEFEFERDSHEPSVFYWREAVFPNWQARLSSGEKVPVYRAGPGFMAMRLPSVTNGERLVLEFKKGWRVWLVEGVSLFTLVGLLVYVGLGKKLWKPVDKPFSRGLGKLKLWLKEQWWGTEHEEY